MFSKERLSAGRELLDRLERALFSGSVTIEVEDSKAHSIIRKNVVDATSFDAPNVLVEMFKESLWIDQCRDGASLSHQSDPV
jgi:hypothetical protein